MKKIAFCFLIYDIINCEELWNIFFRNVDTNKYTIYIHYKSNKLLKYFEKYKINNCIETKYADRTIPLAYNILFQEAFKDIDNYKFVIVSGSCIPFKSFDFIYDKLTVDHYGYFNVCPAEQCFPNCNTLLNVIDKNHISKNSGWFILNRMLLDNLCVDKDDIINTYYKTIYVPEEYYYYTYIKILNLENEIITTLNSANEASTFTNWEGMNYKYPSNRGIKNYTSISNEEVLYLLNSPCLFGRKFNRECIVSFMNNSYIGSISSCGAVL
jgi:hypothetical protein